MTLTTPSWLASVHHDGSARYVTREGPHGRAVTVRVRTERDAPIEHLWLRTAPDGEEHMTPLERGAAEGVCQWWEVRLPLTMPRTSYRFLLRAPEGSWWLTAAGAVRHTPTDATDFRLLLNTLSPTWLRDAVFYQIFPDRFADGDPSNNVRNGEYLAYGQSVVARRWGERPRKEMGGIEFFGGDLAGIVQKLDYLQGLGVSAVYLNPIFTAPSNHKYDVADYDAVDPHLGGNEALVALRQALDERGMRLMLDIVPNHCGASHAWFRAAQHDAGAPTAEFFTFYRRPTEYESWLGVSSLPKLNYGSQRLREWMYEGPESIMRRWLRPPYRLDGWRIDVANMLARQGESQLGHKIGRGIRRAIKAEDHEAYLLGENFFDGTPHLQGDELDGTMNYRGFMFPLLQWLVGYDINGTFGRAWADPLPLPTETLVTQWRTFLAVIPWQLATQQFNLLGSHDTPRIWTVLGEDEARVRLATTLLFTYPGVPSIYYGDEIGMAGEGDPDNRRCMVWEPEAWNQSVHDLYRTLIGLRRSSAALREGGFQVLRAEGDTVAFLRDAPTEQLVIVARRADDGLRALPVRHGGLPDGLTLRDLLSGHEATITNGHLPLETLPAVGVQVWRTMV